jgi:hypothetical protein
MGDQRVNRESLLLGGEGVNEKIVFGRKVQMAIATLCKFLQHVSLSRRMNEC